MNIVRVGDYNFTLSLTRSGNHNKALGVYMQSIYHSVNEQPTMVYCKTTYEWDSNEEPDGFPQLVTTHFVSAEEFPESNGLRKLKVDLYGTFLEYDGAEKMELNIGDNLGPKKE